MDRDEMLAAARERGIKGAHLMKDETLTERLAEPAEAEPAEVTCVVLAANLWLGEWPTPRAERRKVRGDKVTLPRDQAEALAAQDRVTIV